MCALHIEHYRFLNKACIIRNRETDLKDDGSASNPWNLCTVDQVEDLKSLVRVIPIWSTSIILWLNMFKNQFIVLQAQTMDRRIGPNFKIPSASLGVFAVLAMTIWVTIYDRIITPRVGGLPNKQRMGIGLLMACGGSGCRALSPGYCNSR